MVLKEGKVYPIFGAIETSPHEVGLCNLFFLFLHYLNVLLQI